MCSNLNWQKQTSKWSPAQSLMATVCVLSAKEVPLPSTTALDRQDTAKQLLENSFCKNVHQDPRPKTRGHSKLLSLFTLWVIHRFLSHTWFFMRCAAIPQRWWFVIATGATDAETLKLQATRSKMASQTSLHQCVCGKPCLLWCLGKDEFDIERFDIKRSRMILRSLSEFLPLSAGARYLYKYMIYSTLFFEW